MSLLLDTHVVLWWLADDPTISDEVKSRLDVEPDVYVSSATVWEVAIKQAIGKISQPADLPDVIRKSGVAVEYPEHGAERGLSRSASLASIWGPSPYSLETQEVVPPRKLPRST